MAARNPEGPVCQSCAMPLQKPEDFGTARDGSRVNDYCRYCFVNGAFIDPGISMQGMLELCVKAMTSRGMMPEPQARALLTDVLPRLKRWREPVASHS